MEVILQEFCEAGDLAIIDHFLDSNLVSGDVNRSCIGSAAVQKNPQLMQRLLKGASLQHTRDSFYSALSNRAVSIAANRVSVSKGSLDLLSSARTLINPEQAALSSIIPVTATTWESVSPEAKAWVWLLGQMVAQGDESQIREWLFDNPKFIAAFSSVKLHAELAALNAPIVRDRVYAREAVTNVYEAFWEIALAKIAATAGKPATERLTAELNSLGFGYSIQIQNQN